MTTEKEKQLRREFIDMADATCKFQLEIKRRLREIDRKALNAQVLVKRHGKDLSGYGVVAQSFREGAGAMQGAVDAVQEIITPLMSGRMDDLRAALALETLERVQDNIPGDTAARCGGLESHRNRLQEQRDVNEHKYHEICANLLKALERFEEVVIELDYVVVNGRIEAALKSGSTAPLAQVSLDMHRAVASVREVLRGYREQIEKGLR